jgi:alpha-1,6-mannosyltransferase
VTRLAAPLAGAGLVAAMILAVAAARRASPSVVSPVVPPGAWNGVWIVSLVVALVLAIVAWIAARRTPLRLSIAVVVAVLVQTIPLAAPLLLSKDVYLYWDHARLINVHHANPYTATPNDFPNDVAYDYTSESWRPYRAPYGPAWETLARVPAAIAGNSVHAAELAYRILATLGVLAIVLLVARRTRSAAAVVLVGWSPLLALHYAGGGHGDAWMTALLAFAVAYGVAARSGVAWSLSGAFKPVPVLLLPLELARTRFRMSRRWWIGLVATAVAIAVAATIAFGAEWFQGAARGVHQQSPLGGVHWLMELGVRHRYAVVACTLVFVAIYAVLFRDAWRRGRSHLSLAATALCLTSSLLGPWYALWPLALAAVELSAVAGAAALGLSAYLLLADAVSF